MDKLPKGFSFYKTRGGLVAIKDENGNPLLYSISEERALQALPCLERFGGVITSQRQTEKHVDL
ncbi:MAG: hypothetical protein ACO3PJ_03850 [Burkholderiaceae bacterium]